GRAGRGIRSPFEQVGGTHVWIGLGRGAGRRARDRGGELVVLRRGPATGGGRGCRAGRDGGDRDHRGWRLQPSRGPGQDGRSRAARLRSQGYILVFGGGRDPGVQRAAVPAVG